MLNKGRAPTDTRVEARDAITTSLSLALVISVGVAACGGRHPSAVTDTGGRGGKGGAATQAGSGGQGAGGGGRSGSGGSMVGTGGGTGGAGSGGTGTGGTGSGGLAGSRGSGGSGGSASGGAGTAGASGGGSGSGTGGGGRGGPGTGGAAGGPGAGSGGAVGGPLCTGQIVAAASPVTLATTINCTASYQISIEARAVADEAYVAFSTGGIQLASITRSGVTVEQTAIVANMAAVVTDASDVPGLVGGEIDNHGVAWFARSPAGWRPEMVSPVPTGLYTFYQFVGAALGSDGQPRILYSGGDPASLPLVLAKRSPTSGWSSTQIAPGGATPAALVVDSKGRSRVVFNQTDVTGLVLEDWPEGLPTREIALWSDTSWLVAAAGPNGMLAAAKWATGGVRLVFSDGETAAREQTIAVPQGPMTTCPPTESCQSGTCKRDQVVGELALASTSDGAYWLAYGVDHVDQDITAAYTTGEAHICQMNLTADRTTEEVILIRTVQGDSTAATARWRVSTPPRSLTHLDLSARGTRLNLVLSERQIRTFAFDWQKL